MSGISKDDGKPKNITILRVDFTGYVHFGSTWTGNFQFYVSPGIDSAQLIRVLKEFTEALEHGATPGQIEGLFHG